MLKMKKAMASLRAIKMLAPIIIVTGAKAEATEL